MNELINIFYGWIHSSWSWATWLGLLVFGYTWTTKIANVTTVGAAHVNLLQTEKLDRDGTIPLTAGLKWPAIQVASADANTLDDYEEGTWTPVPMRVGAGTSLTYTSSGLYTKIGRVVIISGRITISAIAGQGSSINYISGPPFAEIETNYALAGSVYMNTIFATVTPVSCCIDGGHILFHSSAKEYAHIDDNWAVGTIGFSLVYFTT